MLTHEQLVKKLLRRPGVRKEVERIERQAARTTNRVKAPARIRQAPRRKEAVCQSRRID